MGSRPYVFQQQPGHTSALEGYPAVGEADVRFLDGLSRDVIYPRGCYSSDHGVARPARFAGRNDDNFLPLDYHQHCTSQSTRSREESHDRDANYGPSIYASDFTRSNRYDSWERDQFPGWRREHSWYRGSYHQRSRSPRVRSHNRRDRDVTYDHKRNHEHSSVVPSATVKVMGLSKKTTVEYLHQILARWGPLRNVRVIKERNSSTCRGIAFIDFPSVVKARTMMNAIGYDGLSIGGMMLRFEYRLKRTKSKNRRIHEKQSGERRRQKALERATTDAPAMRQQQHQYEEKVLGEEEEREAEKMESEEGLVEESEAEEKVSVEVEAEDSEAEEMESEEEEVEASEAEEVVLEEGEAEHIEEEQMMEEEGEVEESEAEEMVQEEGEVEESEAEEMEDREEKTEDSEEEGELEEEGEAGDSEAEEMEDGEEKTEDSEEEGKVVEDEGEMESDDEVVVDMNEGDGEESGEGLQHGRVSTKNRSISWTKRETYVLKILVALLSRWRTKSVPWTEILRVGSHIFHPKRTAEQLREKDRRMRGDTHRVRTKGRTNGDAHRVRTEGRMNGYAHRFRTKGRRIKLRR